MMKLKVVVGERSETREFLEEAISIGRAEGSVLRLDDEGIADGHAVIEKTDEGYAVRDLGSRVGTLVNQNRVDSALLAVGDILQVGKALIYVEQVPRPSRHTWIRLRPEQKKSDETKEHGGLTLEHARGLAATISARCRARVRGRDDVIEQVVIAILAGGHVLLEDYPGSGKTTLAKALGGSLSKASSGDSIPTFRRVQFTPDLLPSDVTGVTFFDAKNQTFVFRPGPVFANIVLADEINRASPKVQAALLEAMAEKQVTVDNETHALEDLFCVIATQNPLDTAGTYPLPIPQLDRFLFKIQMKHLTRENELEVLGQHLEGVNTSRMEKVPVQELVDVRPVICSEVKVSPQIHELLVDVAGLLRGDKRIAQGISTRALVLAVPAIQVRAMMHGRDFVSPEDLRALLIPLFAHRIVLKPGVRDAAAVVTECAVPALESAARKTLQKA